MNSPVKYTLPFSGLKIVSIIVISLIAVSTCFSTTIEPQSIPELTGMSDLILLGKVLDEEVILKDDLPYTINHIEVYLVISGEYHRDEMTLEYRGGEHEDSPITGIPHPILHPDKKYLFFLKDFDGEYELSSITSAIEINGNYVGVYEEEDGILMYKDKPLMEVVLEITELSD